MSGDFRPFDLLDDELATLCLLPGLGGQCLSQIGCCSRRFNSLTRDLSLWHKALMSLPCGGALQQRAALSDASVLSGAPADVFALRRRTQVAAAMASGSVVRWHQLRLANRLRGQEGHSAALLAGRWMVVIGGFGGAIRNTVSALDTFALARRGSPPEWQQVDVGGTMPRPTYGHSTTTLPPSVCGQAGRECNTLALLGGVRYGGYAGDVGDLTLLHCSFSEVAGSEGEAPNIRVSASWEPMFQGGRLMSAAGEQTACDSRAYQSATVARIGSQDVMVVFGGIHEGAAFDSLQILSLNSADTAAAALVGGISLEARLPRCPEPAGNGPAQSAMAWWRPFTEGAAPSRRFGHSCAAVDRSLDGSSDTGWLLFVGGSNGSDLLRDGEDHYGEIHVLSVTPPAPMVSAAAGAGAGMFDGAMDVVVSEGVRLSWSQPRIRGSVPRRFGGRCHVMAALPDKLICFGGGARISNSVGCLQWRRLNRDSSSSTGPASNSDEEEVSTAVPYAYCIRAACVLAVRTHPYRISEVRPGRRRTKTRRMTWRVTEC